MLVSILAPGTRCTGEGPIHAHAIHTGHHTTCCIDIWNGNTTIDEVHIDNVRTKKIHIVCRIQSDDAVPDVDPGTTIKVDLMAIATLMKRSRIGEKGWEKNRLVSLCIILSSNALL